MEKIELEKIELEKIFTIFKFDFEEIKKSIKTYKFICENREKLNIEHYPVIEKSLYNDIVMMLCKFIDENNKVVNFNYLTKSSDTEIDYKKMKEEFKKIIIIRWNIIAHTNYWLHMESINKKTSKYKIDQVDYNLKIQEIENYINIIWDILFKIDNCFDFKIWFHWLNPNL